MATFDYRLVGGAPPISVEDFTTLARRKVPAMAWPYLSGGADGLVTLEDNRAAFRRWRLRVRSLTGVGEPRLATSVAGETLALPLILAPTGLVGLAHWTGDVAAARAAEARGTRHVLSTVSSYSLEEVAAATSRDHWFQLYPYGDRDKVGELMNRAATAGFTTLFVTVDVAVRGNREGERRSGMTTPPTVTPGRLLDVAAHPAWWWNLLRRQRATAVHFTAGRRSLASAVEGVRAQERIMQADLDWDDLAWMREHWKGPLYVKGILDADDAARAVDEGGAQGVVVSNHGGRQLDFCQASLDALPAIVERVGARAEVLMDGGVRRGTDVIIALALGARAVLVGRPYVHALAAAGEAGVRRMIDILREEMTRDLILMGCADVADLDRTWLIRAPGG